MDLRCEIDRRLEKWQERIIVSGCILKMKSRRSATHAEGIKRVIDMPPRVRRLFSITALNGESSEKQVRLTKICMWLED